MSQRSTGNDSYPFRCSPHHQMAMMILQHRQGGVVEKSREGELKLTCRVHQYIIECHSTSTGKSVNFLKCGSTGSEYVEG